MIKAKLVETGTASLAVAVAKNGKILWEEGFGWADRENMVPADEHTMYSLASVSKPITATGLMVLKERGLLDLDHPINDYLGESKLKAWVGSSDEATVRRVANHTAGLPLHFHFFFEDEPHRPPPRDETIRRYGNIVSIPGERFEYSNLGYGILDYVISLLSGKSYPDFMREEVFLPLGMTHTSVHIGPRLEKYEAVRYGPDGLPIPSVLRDTPGAGAVYSSAHDLVRFGLFHLKAHIPDQKAIISDETIDEMQQPTVDLEKKGQLIGQGKGQGYGMGWFIEENQMGYRSIYHAGGSPGVSTKLTLIPSEKLTVVVLTSTAGLERLFEQEILSTLLPEYAKNRARFEAEQKKEKEKPRESTIVFKPTPELIGEWSGSVHTYKEEIILNLWFKENGDIHAQLGDQLKTLLNDVGLLTSRAQDGFIRGRMMGNIGTEDANRYPYYLHVELKPRGQVLNGMIISRPLPGQRRGSGLSYCAELKKQETGEA